MNLRRILLHLAFWATYWFVYAYTYSRYDGNFGKYALTEGLQMPARMLATYGSFWLIEWVKKYPRYAWLGLMGVAGANIAGGMLNRTLKLLFIVPALLPDATIQFWDLNRMLVDVFDCALASGAALTARLFFRRQEGLRREAILHQEKTDAELVALKSQLHPHFLFNALNSIYALARLKSDKTAAVTLQLAHLLRFVLYETRKPSIPLSQEVRILEDYISLEKIRFDDERLRLQTRFDLDDPDQPITPLLLLPLAENAFKHGVSEHRDEAWVNLSVVLKNGKLSVAVENSRDAEAPANTEGIGLANLRRQLELVYPGRHTLGVQEEPAAFRVRLEILF